MSRTGKANVQADLNGAVRAATIARTKRGLAAKTATNGAHDEQSSDLHILLHALQAMRVGDFSVRLPRDQVGLAGKIADTFNEIVAANERMVQQLEQVGQVVGRDGKTKKRVSFGLPHGAWGEMEGSVNTPNDDLLWPTTAVTRAISAVAQGDLLQTVQLEVNTMVEQLRSFAAEVTRVAREVGTEGRLGGQAVASERGTKEVVLWR